MSCGISFDVMEYATCFLYLCILVMDLPDYGCAESKHATQLAVTIKEC
jgi:hypothetical protein